LREIQPRGGTAEMHLFRDGNEAADVAKIEH
jgi:hypothetical protein